MTKLEQLKSIFSIINDNLSKEETKKIISALIEFVKQLNKKNSEIVNGLDTKYDDRVGKIEKKLLNEITKFFVQEAKKVRTGKDGRDGKDADPTEIALQAQKLTLEALKPQIPTTETLLNNLPEFGEKIVDAVNLLPTDNDDDKIGKEHIKGWEDLEERLLKIASSKSFVGGGGGVGKHNVNVYDLSDRLDGVTKTFTLPSMWKLLSVQGSSFPNAFRPTIDYTVSGNSITFTDEIDANSTLAQGQTIIVMYSE